MRNNIAVVTIDDRRWREYRDLRLRALQELGGAFGRTYQEEVNYPDLFWQHELSKTRKKDSNIEIYFVEKDKKIIAMGKIKYNKTKRFGHIAKYTGIFVDPRFRGMGLGELLLKEVINRTFKRKKIKKIKLIVNSNQLTAINLYKKCGFWVVGKLKKEFRVGNTYQDGYQMELVR